MHDPRKKKEKKTRMRDESEGIDGKAFEVSIYPGGSEQLRTSLLASGCKDRIQHKQKCEMHFLRVTGRQAHLRSPPEAVVLSMSHAKAGSLTAFHMAKITWLA